MTRRHLLALFAAGLACPAARAQAPALKPVVSDAEFADLMATVRPRAGEDQFATIPWMTSLWDARVKAAAEGKPILLWEMDGHPLGCG